MTEVKIAGVIKLITYSPENKNNNLFKNVLKKLVGGFNPSKNIRQIGHLPQYLSCHHLNEFLKKDSPA